MEIIKKKICLEDFKSRIPSIIQTVDGEKVNSWGKTVKCIKIFGKVLKYGTFIKMYYKLLDTIMKSSYYQYDNIEHNWKIIEYDWRNSFKDKDIISYVISFPEENLYNKQIVGITDEENLLYFYDEVNKLTDGNYDGFYMIDYFNKIIGRHIVPLIYKCNECGHSIMDINGDDDLICSECGKSDFEQIQEVYVPYFIYESELPNLIGLMEILKEKSHLNCCNKREYEEHGGDVFLNYLKTLNNNISSNHSFEIPTIDIPLLLTCNYMDLGQYRTYNVDVIDSNSNSAQTSNTKSNNSIKTNIVKTSGESKLLTLKRRCSVDDNGLTLPGIIEENSNKLILPFTINHIKNVQHIDKEYYGDLIYSIREFNDSMSCGERQFNNVLSKVGDNACLIKYVNDTQTLVKPTLFKKTQNLNVSFNSEVYINRVLNNDLLNLKNALITAFNDMYPKYLCLKHEYNFTYKVYSLKSSKNEIRQGYVYIIYNNPQVEVTYVNGGKISVGDNVNLSESNPYELSNNDLNNWEGKGIWYREILPMKKMCEKQFKINGTNKTFSYDEIDFESKQRNYSFEGIDFVRKNYILCNDIIYKSEQYLDDSLDDFVFKDEKMIGLNFPLKEEYDVVIDRGSSAAFERHMQMGEIKTWEDLENYRNGMFLNK